MNQNLLAPAAAGGLLLALTSTDPGTCRILQMPDFASPASMSMHEESTITAGIPLMGVFNNLVVFDQHVAQNSLASVVPELASDEPDQKIQTYVCGADRNYTGYCNPETDALIDRQSAESDPEKRRKLVWDVER